LAPIDNLPSGEFPEFLRLPREALKELKEPTLLSA